MFHVEAPADPKSCEMEFRLARMGIESSDAGERNLSFVNFVVRSRLINSATEIFMNLTLPPLPYAIDALERWQRKLIEPSAARSSDQKKKHRLSNLMVRSRHFERCKNKMPNISKKLKSPVWRHGSAREFRVRSGGIAQNLVATAKQIEADLIVLGPHRKRPTRDAPAGVAANLLDTYSDACKREARSGLQDLLRTVSNDSSRYELILENATSTAAVQGVVSRLNPDLLIFGTRGRGRFRRALLGSVASRMLSGARSDVLVVPDRGARTSWQRARSERLGLDVISGI